MQVNLLEPSMDNLSSSDLVSSFESTLKRKLEPSLDNLSSDLVFTLERSLAELLEKIRKILIEQSRLGNTCVNIFIPKTFIDVSNIKIRLEGYYDLLINPDIRLELGRKLKKQNIDVSYLKVIDEENTNGIETRVTGLRLQCKWKYEGEKTDCNII